MKNPSKPIVPEKESKLQISSDSKFSEFSDKKTVSSIAAPPKSIKKPPKSKENNLILQTVFGITSNSHNNLALNPISGEIAYPAGSMLVIYNPITNKQSKFIFSPNKKPFTCVTYSKDGKFLIAGEGICKNPEINIWDLRHENPPVCLKGHKFGIEKILFSPNQQYLVSIGDENDKGLLVWDWEKETKLTMNKMSKKINAATFNISGTLLITAGVQHLKFWAFDKDGKIILTKPKDTENVFIIEGKSAALGQKFQNKTFNDVSCLEDHVFALDSEGILCVLNEQRKLEKWMDLKVRGAFTIQLTPLHVICGCSDGIIRFFDAKSLHHVTTLPKPPALGCYNVEKTNIKASVILPGPESFGDVICLITDELRGKLVALYSDRTVFIWDVHDLEKVSVKRSFLNHNGTIHDIQTLENSSYEVTFFATGSIDQTIRIWNLLEEEKGMPNLPGLRRNLYSKNLTRILYLGDNYEHFKFHKEETTETSTNKQVRCLKCSHDGQYLASGDLDGVLRIFSLITFAKIVEIVSHDQEILCMDFTPENPLDVFLLATGSRDRLIHIYNGADEFKLVTTLEDHNSSISALQFAYHKAKNNILLMSCGVDKTLIFREYKPKEQKPFVQIHLEIDKNSKFFTMDLNHENNIAVLGQEKKMLLWSIDEMKAKGTIETKEEDKSTGKFLPLDNLKISVDSSGTYIAVSNNDKVVRIRDFATGNLVAKLSCGDIITSLAFTQNSKYLITASSKGCIYVWKLSQEIKGNIEKKKQQLGLLAKRLKEMLGKSRDLTLDSFWIEEEIKQFLNKEEIGGPNQNNDNSSVHHLLDELNKEGKPEDQNKKKAKLQELNANKPKEIFQKPEEIILDFGSELSNIVNNQDLPNWAQSHIKPAAREELGSLLKIDNKFKLSQIEQDPNAIKEESVHDVLLNNQVPKWLEKKEFEESKANPSKKLDPMMETDFIEIDIEKEANLVEMEEKEEKDEIYQKQDKENINQIVEESEDPFVQKNYMDLDKAPVNSPLRTSLSSFYFKEHSQKKNESPLFREEDHKEEKINQRKVDKELNFDKEPISDRKKTAEKKTVDRYQQENNKKVADFLEEKNEVSYERKKVELSPEKKTWVPVKNVEKKVEDKKIEQSPAQTQDESLNKKANNNVIQFVRNPKKEKKPSIIDLSEISEQMQMINKNIEQVQVNMKKSELPNPLFDSQVDIQDLETFEQKPKQVQIFSQVISIDKSNLIERSKEEILNKARKNDPDDLMEFQDDFEEYDENEDLDEKINKNDEIDIEKKILSESRKIKENKEIDEPGEDFHEMIVKALSPVKERVLLTEQEFKNSRSGSPMLKKEKDDRKEGNEFERKMEVFFENLNRSITNFREDFEKFAKNEKNKSYLDDLSSKIERKAEGTKGFLDKITGKETNFMKLSEIENSNILNIDNSQNKSISHFIVDQSRDLLETYSRQLIQLVKSQINNKN